jgi:hypothetical protein
MAGVVFAGPGDRKQIGFLWDPHPEDPWFNLYWSPTVQGTMEDPDEAGTTWVRLATIPRGVNEFTLPEDWTDEHRTGFFALTAENTVGESDFSNGLWVEPFPSRPQNLRIRLVEPQASSASSPSSGALSPIKLTAPGRPTPPTSR